MSKKILSIVFILFLSSGLFAFSNQSDEKISFVEIKTFSKEIYDDCIYRTIYTGFKVYDGNGNKILSVGETYDKPAIIKLNEGDYTIEVKNVNEIVTKKISVNCCNIRVKF